MSSSKALPGRAIEIDPSLYLKRNLLLFYLYRIVSRCYFHLSVLFLFFYEIEVGLPNVIMLLASYGLVTTVTANLGGLLQGRLRLKEMVALGEAMKAVGLGVILYGSQIGDTRLWLLFLGQMIGGAGFSLAVSSDGGLLRSVASSDNEAFNRTQASSQSLMFLATLVAGWLGAILYDYEAHWPLYAAMVASVVATIIVCFVKEGMPAAKKPPASAAAKPGAAETGAAKTGAAPAGPKAALSLDAQQRFWMHFYSISRAYTLGPFVAILPFYFIEINLDNYLFGFVLSLFSLGAFLSAMYSNRLMKRYGLTTLMVSIIGLMATSFLLFACGEFLADRGIDYLTTGLVAVSLLGLGAGGVRPLAMANINLGALTPEHRTRLLSRMERNFGIGNGILLAIAGYLLTEKGFEPAMIFVGISYVSLLACLMLTRGTAD